MFYVLHNLVELLVDKAVFHIGCYDLAHFNVKIIALKALSQNGLSIKERRKLAEVSIGLRPFCGLITQDHEIPMVGGI